MYDPTFIEFNCEFGALVALLQKRGFRREQAMDAASEAMACAYQRWSRIDRSMRGWLRTAAYHIACRQAQRAREEPFRAVAGGWGVSTHYDVDVMEIIQEHNRLLRLLQLLPAQQRRVMERHLAGFNTKEISDQLNMLLLPSDRTSDTGTTSSDTSRSLTTKISICGRDSGCGRRFRAATHCQPSRGQ